MNQFTEARYRLTAWYTLISAFLLAIFTIAAYSSESLAFRRIERALSDPVDRPVLTKVLERRINGYQKDFRRRLITMDAVLLVLSTVGAYILSGKTLAPIERMMEEQEAFAGEASHQLRTPLTIIKTELSFYQKSGKDLTLPVKNLISSVLEEVERMRVMVDELVTFVRPTMDEYESLNVVKEVEMVAIKMNAVSRRVRFAASIQSAVVHASKEYIRQIMEVLIDNALKYSSQTVDVGVKKHHREVWITVTDYGVGIDSRDIPHIFDRFYRGAHKGVSGTGLGLAIANKFAEAVHGRIQVVSEKGKGTTFTVKLPLVS